MLKLVKKVRAFFASKEEGASLAEYGLLVALIAVVCILAVTALGTNVAAKIQAAANAIGG
jgi:pilus assembly protein Flp/PilA